MSVGIVRQNIIIQFHFWEYIYWNQKFTLDSQRPSICSVK
jgi:hypothetical protein